LKTLRSNVAESAGDFGFFLFKGDEMFGAAKINKFNVDFILGALTLFKENNILKFYVKVDDAILVDIHEGTEELFNDFANKLLAII
jgi:hypothetical protein